jgi:hypothetical protein
MASDWGMGLALATIGDLFAAETAPVTNKGAEQL